jgi:predicted amidohydrolase
MSRALPVAVVQAETLPANAPFSSFADHVQSVLERFPQSRLVIYPELHHCGLRGNADEREAMMQDSAESLDGPRTNALRELAADLGVWLVPGSFYERSPDSAAIHNTTVLVSPTGELVAHYRKLFPWRPYESSAPGDRFVVADISGVGRIGLSICYDSWFPEVARHLAWMGAEVIISPTLTTTSDRAQELVLARAQAIVNQVFFISVNGAAPGAGGRSLIVDPEGNVRVEAGEAPTVVTDVLELEQVSTVRRYGTSGLNRMWNQFSDDDAPVDLPLYSGRIDPRTWAVADPDA